ncbi:MAG: right-handed parallel beta-helix repeat-containing protein [bacterium]|nr:right-handed parallel beta-helix repeat-containing protein [bacterium]
MSCLLCVARTLRVPAEFETIQGALNALLANDTVLVDTGLYVEELTAPALSFVMIGNISADTSDHALPIIDPAGLTSPGGRGCMSLTSGNVRIQNFVFRNGTAMHPHWTGDVGGIHILGSMNLSLSDCRFDSVYYGVFAHGDLNPTINLERCEFVHSMGRCIFATTIIAENCSFHTDTVDWAQLTFGDYSSIVNCSFSGNFWGGNVLLCYGKYVTISGCVFSNFEFAPASTALVLRIGASEVTDNVFADFQKGMAVLSVGSNVIPNPT